MIIHFVSKISSFFILLYYIMVLSIITGTSSSYASTAQVVTPGSNTASLPCPGRSSFWTGLWGVAAPEPRLTLGMWSAHATDKKRNNKNDMLGFSYYGLGVGTFVNSYYERAYALTIQRYWLMRPLYKEINYEFGYRLGLVTGYRGYNISGFQQLKNAPVLPFAQLVAGLNWKYFGWEISTPDPYVISTSFYIRFL